MITAYTDNNLGLYKVVVDPDFNQVDEPAFVCGKYFWNGDFWTPENSYNAVYADEDDFLCHVNLCVKAANWFWEESNKTKLCDVLQKLQEREDHLFEVRSAFGLTNGRDTADWINYKEGDLDLPF
jgi:hypothetical protein